MMYFAALYHAAPAAQERRPEVRPAHRSYLEPILRSGKIHFAGPFTDGSGGGLILFEAPSIAEVWSIVSGDPYIQAGIFNVVEIRPVDKVYPS
jgi:uncharacterized protein YciI